MLPLGVILKNKAMKRINLTLICLLLVNVLFAQVPHKFNYQAVLRSSSGQALVNKSVRVRISFLNGSETGNSLYTEEHSVVTNSQGVFNVEAGGSSNVILGSFASIDWSTSSIWLKVEVDENLTGSFTNLGAKQLLSVPFALYAESGNQGPKGDTGNGISGIVDNGNGTLTINYTNGGSYLTPNLKGPQGEKGEQGLPGTGLVNKGNWVSGTIYNPGDYVFASNTQQTGNAMWIVKASASFTSNAEPRIDLTNWIEFQAPQGPPGPLVSGTSGQTLRNNGTTWIANDNIFNDGTNVGIGIALPTQKLDVNGAIRLRGNIFDYDNLSGSNGQLLYKTTNGIKWQSPTYANIGTNGTAGQLALWSNSTSLQGLTNLTWGTSLQVQSITTADPDAPILEVKNSAGQVVFGVYQGGVRIYVDDSAVKGARGGFAVGGLSQTKAGTSTEYFRITPDSARIYFNNSTVKGARGGFAVGGLSQTKATTSSEYLRITRDSARIYVNNSPVKGARGGFAVGGLSQTKATSDNFMQLTPDNYFIGHQSGSKTTTGLYNNFFGYQSGMLNTTGNYNSFIGYKSGYSNTTGYSNVFMGYEAGSLNKGNNNLFLGNNTGRINEADNNIFIGNEAGLYNTSGQHNAFVGIGAGYKNTSGSSNVFIGNLAGYSNTTGYSNIFLGPYCGYWGAGGAFNIFMGQYSGYNNSTGTYNVFLGYSSGYGNTEGEKNVFIGVRAGEANTIGKGNVFMGDNSGLLNTTGDKNIFIGVDCGRGNLTGISNVFLGSSSGYSNTTGGYNVFLGNSSGFNNLSGFNNVFLGSESGKQNREGYDNVFVGTFSGQSNTTGTSNVFLGVSSGYFNNANNNIFIGTLAGYSNVAGKSNVFIGNNAGYNNNADYNVFLGTEAGKSNTSGTFNTFMGFLAGRANTEGNSNVFIGNLSGIANTTGGSNVFIGNESGITNSTGINNVFLGYNAGYYSNADYNTFIGNQTGFKNNSGYKNVMIGFKAGFENTSGICNVFVGPDAGGKNTTAWYNTFVGIGAGYNTTSNGFNSYYGINSGFAMTSGSNNAFYGSNSGYWFDGGSGNTFIGAEAGRGGPDDDPADPAGNYNTALGSFSGVVLEGASKNLLLGAYSGSYLRTGSSNVFIGYGAGFFETGSNKLFVDNQLRADAATSYTSSLIYGEFSSTVANQFLRVNGKLGVNKQPSYDIDANGSINSASYYIGGTRKDQNWDNAYTSRLSSASGTTPLTLTLTSNALSGSIADATTSAKGVVQLSNSYSGTSQTLATTEKSVSDGLGTKVTGSGITMGKINLYGDGVIASVGLHSLERSGNNIIVKNNTGNWSHVWWQGQQGTTFVGNGYAIAAGGSPTIITLSPPTNSWGYEIHFGDVDGGTSYCSVWIQYSQGRLVGHYTKF